MNSFKATDDAEITDTYQDETGASATVIGNSRVPFNGKLRFILIQNGIVLYAIDRLTPVLLTGDDETVEISWNKTLSPGTYLLRTVLFGQEGDVKDLRENIVEAKKIERLNATEDSKKSPISVSTLVASIVVFMLLRRLKLEKL